MMDAGVPKQSTRARLWTLDISRETRDGVRVVALPGRIGVTASPRLSAVLNEELLLSVDDGWLQAWWRPQGLTFFPGQFAEEKWRQVLDAMSTVANSLDAAS